VVLLVSTSRTFTSPLDVVKILFQVQSEPIKEGAQSKSGRTVYTGFLSAFPQIYREEGIRGFWKGNLVACVRLFPYSAIKFYAFDLMKRYVSDDKGNMGTGEALAIGALSGVMAVITTYPLDLVKTRLTVQKEGSGPKTYNGIIDCMAKTAREEGFTGLYKGMLPSIVGAIPFEGGTFMAYEFLRIFSGGKDSKQLSPWINFGNGCLAAGFAQTFSYPFDLIRKRLQAQSKAHGMLGERYTGMTDAFAKTYKEEGFFGLYKGTVANIAKVVPYAGLSFMTWEACKEGFTWYNKTYGFLSHGPQATHAAPKPKPAGGDNKPAVVAPPAKPATGDSKPAAAVAGGSDKPAKPADKH